MHSSLLSLVSLNHIISLFSCLLYAYSVFFYHYFHSITCFTSPLFLSLPTSPLSLSSTLYLIFPISQVSFLSMYLSTVSIYTCIQLFPSTSPNSTFYVSPIIMSCLSLCPLSIWSLLCPTLSPMCTCFPSLSSRFFYVPLSDFLSLISHLSLCLLASASVPLCVPYLICIPCLPISLLLLFPTCFRSLSRLHHLTHLPCITSIYINYICTLNFFFHHITILHALYNCNGANAREQKVTFPLHICFQPFLCVNLAI